MHIRYLFLKVTGPMSRFCSDLLPMYRVLAAGNVNKLKLDQKVAKTYDLEELLLRYTFHVIITLLPHQFRRFSCQNCATST